MKVVQLLPTFMAGDAIGNHAIAIDGFLRAQGHDSRIHAINVLDNARHLGRPLGELSADRQTATIYHYSIGDAKLNQLFRELPGRKVLWYHNITPAVFFAGYDGPQYEETRLGRAQLADFREVVDLAVGDSEFNAAELVEVGYATPRVAPPVIMDWSKLDAEPDPEVMERFGDGKTNFLFVGRLSPNKCQEDVIRAFGWYRRYIDAQSRLILVGGQSLPEYKAELLEVARSVGASADVIFPDHISQAGLLACYRRAGVFLCLSEHEGFCVPLLEAMHHGVPVLAYAAGAVPETLGGAGVLVKEKDIPLIAELARLLVTDQGLRARIIARQRERLNDYSPEVVGGKIQAILREVCR